MHAILAVVSGALWGLVWALALCSPIGKFIARRHTWLAVVIGVGGDLLVLLIVLPVETWLAVCAVVAASSVAVIVRSLWNEWNEHNDLMGVLRGDKDPSR